MSRPYQVNGHAISQKIMNQAKFPSILEGHWQFLLCLPLLVVSLCYTVIKSSLTLKSNELYPIWSLLQLALCFCLSSVSELCSEQKAHQSIRVLKSANLKLVEWISKISKSADNTLDDPIITNPRAFVCKESLCAATPRVLCMYQDYTLYSYWATEVMLSFCIL